NGHDGFARKSSWFNWNKALASKKNGGITVLFYSNGFGASFRMARRCGLPSSKLCLVSMELLGSQLSQIGDPSGLISFKLSIRSKIKSKSISVADKLGLSSLYLSFRRPPRGGIEQESFNLLCQSVRGLVLSNIEDRWSWSLEGSGLFFVKSSRAYIDNLLLPKADAATRWIRILPIKINVFA
ncbi:hypothetical protein Tco_1415664, partial [Tanacetum coccineum]